MITRTLAGLALAAILAAPAAAQEQQALAAPTPGAANLIETARAAGGYGTLLEALEAAGLISTLEGAGPFTIFAPSDEAFAKLPAGKLDALKVKKTDLAHLLKFHVVEGKFTVADLVSRKDDQGFVRLMTLDGREIQLHIDGSGAVHVGAGMANVVKPDVKADNGVLHGIDAVAMPADAPKAMP